MEYYPERAYFLVEILKPSPKIEKMHLKTKHHARFSFNEKGDSNKFLIKVSNTLYSEPFNFSMASLADSLAVKVTKAYTALSASRLIVIY